MIKTIIVDDEPVIAEEMEDLLRSHESYEVLGTYTEPLAALEGAQKINPDCAFLDIEMMGMSGIELAEKLLVLNQNMEIVFVTAYNHYAVQAFEVNAIDYLLKPVSPERLRKTLERIEKRSPGKVKRENHACIIKCFGGFEVFVGDQIIKWSRAKTRELFAYLIQWQGKSLSKYALCELFWPEHSPEQGLAYLQTSLWTIRKKLKEAGYEGLRVEYSDHRYFVHLEGLSCDVVEFEKHYQAFEGAKDIGVRRLAADCYHGPYMEGEGWLWAYPDQAKYERMYQAIVGCGIANS